VSEPEKNDVDLIIVHGNTDKPTESGFVTYEMVEECVVHGGLFLDYTTAGGHWSKDDEGRYSGGFDELVQALEELDGLESTDTLLNKLESRYRELELLSALSILSQGYLAVHAEAYDEKEGWEPEEISDALEQMEWTEGLISSGIDSRVEEVTKPDWWRVFDGEDSLLAEAEGEWGDETDGWSTVKDLLIRVTGDREEEDQDRGDTDEREPKPLESEEDRELVADAYCKLVERLGGDPCQ